MVRDRNPHHQLGSAAAAAATTIKIIIIISDAANTFITPTRGTEPCAEGRCSLGGAKLQCQSDVGARLQLQQAGVPVASSGRR